MELPKVPPTDETGERGVLMVREKVLKLGHIFRETTARDYGIDGQIEIVTSENGVKYASGKLLAVQIKCGPSHFRFPNDDGWAFYCKAPHINYWREHSLPVILILCDPETNQCYWEWITQQVTRPTSNGAYIQVLKSKTLDKTGGELEKIARQRSMDVKSTDTFILPLNDSYAIDLPDDEIAVLCSEISLAYSRKRDVHIDIGFTVEDFCLNELNGLYASGNLTVEQRQKRNEYEQAMDWFTMQREALSSGIELLFTEGLTRLGFISSGHWEPVATALKAFVDYHIYQRVGRHRPAGMALDAYPGNGVNTPVARIYLDADQELALYKKFSPVRNAPASAEKVTLPDNPFWFYGAILAEMGHDLTYQRVLPAVISALVSHFRNNAISPETFFSSAAGDLQGWQVGLA